MKRHGKTGRGRQWLKRVSGIGLALVLAAGLCACGGGGNGRVPGKADESESSSQPGGSPGNANAALAKENVYRVREIAVPKLAEGGTIGVESVLHLNDRIYAVLKRTKWGEIPQYCIFSMDESGNILGSAFLELQENSGSKLPDGGSETPGDSTEGEVSAEPDPNIWEQEDIQYSDFVTGADGRTYALRQYKYTYVNYLTDQSLEEQHEYVCCWDEKGALLWQAEPWGAGEEIMSVRAIFPAADGTSKLLLTGEKTLTLSLGADGALSETGQKMLSEDTGKALEDCRRLLRREDGSCLLLCRNTQEDSLSCVKYDLRTDTLGELFKLPETLPGTSLNSAAFAAGADSDLIYANRDGVFSCNMGDFRGSLKMDYLNSDRMITDARSILALDETHFFMFFKEEYGDELKAGIFEYVSPGEIPDKAVLLLGGLTLDSGIKNMVFQYNRKSEQYRMVLREYASAEELNLEIVSGRMPDILLVKRLADEEAIPMKSYIEKGMIADVGKLIEEDADLSGTEFLSNVFEAYSVDGRLMYVVPSFNLTTMAARASHVGDGSGWSMEKMQEALGGMGEDAQLLDGLDRNTFIEKLLEYRGNDFIDLKTGKCAFDSPAFIKAMKFAYTLPEESHYAAQDGEDGYEMQYLRDRTLLKELWVWSFSSDLDERVCYVLNGYLGGDYTLVGFPGSAESNGETAGALIQGENLMALSALSDNLEGAWEFARYYLTEEYQRNLGSGLPVNKQIFEEWALEETRRSYYMDENGEKVEYDLTLWQDGEEVTIEPLSRERMDELIAYIESVTTVPYEDRQVLNIIYEEMGSYFSGQKTAEDVAAVIQGRVQMYVQENQ